MFCFYGLLKRLLNGIGLHWSEHSVEETSIQIWLEGETSHGNEYLDVHEIVIWCLIPVLNKDVFYLFLFWLYGITTCLSSWLLFWNLSLQIQFFQSQKELSKTKQIRIWRCCVVLLFIKLSILCKTQALLKLNVLGYFVVLAFWGGLWVALFWWWVFCSSGVPKF